MSEKVTIVSVETKPESDPYHADTDGISYTALKLYEDGHIRVLQEYNDNSQPESEWNGRTQVWLVPGHPLEAEMHKFLENNLELLQTALDNHDVVWNGRNLVGSLNAEGRDASEKIEQSLNRGFDENYEYWLAEDWLRDADDLPTTEFETYAKMIRNDAPERVIIAGIVEYLENRYA